MATPPGQFIALQDFNALTETLSGYRKENGLVFFCLSNKEFERLCGLCNQIETISVQQFYVMISRRNMA